VGDYDLPVRRGAVESGQLLQDELVRQAVKAVAVDSLLGQAARQGEDAGHVGQGVVEGGVEAGHLRQVGEAARDRLNCLDLRRQVHRVERGQAAQLGEHLGRDALGGAVARPAVDDPVPDGVELARVGPAAQPGEQRLQRRAVVRQVALARFEHLARAVLHLEAPAAQADPLQLAAAE
jgi:hypothetical protein